MRLLGHNLGAEDVELVAAQQVLHGVDDPPGPGDQAGRVVPRHPPERHVKPRGASVTSAEHLSSEVVGIKTVPQEVHLFVVEQFPDQDVSPASETNIILNFST